MENEVINNIDLKDVGIFISGVAIPGVVMLIKTIGAEWRKNAPIRKAKRTERKAARLARRESRLKK